MKRIDDYPALKEALHGSWHNGISATDVLTDMKAFTGSERILFEELGITCLLSSGKFANLMFNIATIALKDPRDSQKRAANEILARLRKLSSCAA